MFVLFGVMITITLGSLLLVNWNSTRTIQLSAIRNSKLQLQHAADLLDDEEKRAGLIAVGVIESDPVKQLINSTNAQTGHSLVDEADYISILNNLKSSMKTQQEMSTSITAIYFWWPAVERKMSTRVDDNDANRIINKAEATLKNKKNSGWFSYENKMFYSIRQAQATISDPMIIVELSSDLYDAIKTRASAINGGGSFIMAGRRLIGNPNTNEQLMYAKYISGKKRHKEKYLGNQFFSMKSKRGNLELVSYVPTDRLKESSKSITIITLLFAFLITIIAILVVLIFYRNVSQRLLELTRAMKLNENGKLGVQIEQIPDDEFGYVFRQFNQMSQASAHLLRSLLHEQELLSRAKLLQLQYQINPHFLYNSLNYIVAMSDHPESVTEMAIHLSRYYRYRINRTDVSVVSEEVAFVKDYLSIIAMRKNINYKVYVDEGLDTCQILPLLLEPLVENAVEHGIEESDQANEILVTISAKQSRITCSVEDDGPGLSEHLRKKLEHNIFSKDSDREGKSLGLWNVNQRLINYYGQGAQLSFGVSRWGGFLATFSYPQKNNDDLLEPEEDVQN